MSRSFRRVIVVVLAGGVLWSCGSERVTVSEGGQGAGEQVRRSLNTRRRAAARGHEATGEARGTVWSAAKPSQAKSMQPQRDSLIPIGKSSSALGVRRAAC